MSVKNKFSIYVGTPSDLINKKCRFTTFALILFQRRDFLNTCGVEFKRLVSLKSYPLQYTMHYFARSTPPLMNIDYYCKDKKKVCWCSLSILCVYEQDSLLLREACSPIIYKLVVYSRSAQWASYSEGSLGSISHLDLVPTGHHLKWLWKTPLKMNSILQGVPFPQWCIELIKSLPKPAYNSLW